MSIQYYTLRPPVTVVVQWTGSNFAEVRSVYPDAVDNGDGTVTIANANPLAASIIAATGDWLSCDTSGGSHAVSSANLYATAQTVPSVGPLAYTVTDA